MDSASEDLKSQIHDIPRILLISNHLLWKKKLHIFGFPPRENILSAFKNIKNARPLTFEVKDIQQSVKHTFPMEISKLRFYTYL